MANIISKDKLLESGLHYGHQTKSWNPAMKPFIAMARRNIHIIDLEKTVRSLENSYNIVKKIAEKGGSFLFVGTQRQSSKTVRENAERVGAFYIDHRWLGGLLTNFRTIQNSVNKLRRLERLEKENFAGYTKKEAILMKRDLEKLEKALGGIKFMRRLPQAIFVTSIRNEDIAIKEAKKMGIPVFGIADTNVDPYTVNFPIFGNDDANKSVALVTTVIADAIAASKNEKQMVAYVEDDKVNVIGVEEREEKPQRPRPERKPRSEFKKDEVKAENNNKVEAPKKEEAKVSDDASKKAVEKAKQDKMRKDLLAKIESKKASGLTNDFSDIKLTELYGVGPKTEEYFKSINLETIDKIANSNPSEEEILGLPGIASLNRNEKIKAIIEEAKFIISNS